MATATIRTTYALDAETVERLERLARQWNLSRSATLRKLIREAEAAAPAGRAGAWERLRGSLPPAQAVAWRRQLQQERRAADPGRHGRGRGA